MAPKLRPNGFPFIGTKKITFLLALTLTGLVYSSWLLFFGTLTGTDQVDGIIGVLKGTNSFLLN